MLSIETVLASFVLVIVLASPSSAHSKTMRTPVWVKSSDIAVIPRSVEAAKEVGACSLGVSSGPVVELCNRTWRGHQWKMDSRYSGEIQTPSGVIWLFRCNYDVIERRDNCSFATGDEFLLVRSDGYFTVVNWGFERFPGSAMAARFDDEGPMSTVEENWTSDEARTIYRKMASRKVMRYRYYDWPNNVPHDGRIDLAGFADTSLLFEAIRDDFTLSRVLKRISVPD